MAIILEVLFAPSSFDVFNNVVFQELFKQLNRLTASHFGAEVLVGAEQLVQAVHGLRGFEATLVAFEAAPVLPQGHRGAEELDDLVPLREENKAAR